MRDRYHEVRSTVVEDASIAVLTSYTNVVATPSEVSGYEPHPTAISYGLETRQGAVRSTEDRTV